MQGGGSSSSRLPSGTWPPEKSLPLWGTPRSGWGARVSDVGFNPAAACISQSEFRSADRGGDESCFGKTYPAIDITWYCRNSINSTVSYDHGQVRTGPPCIPATRHHKAIQAVTRMLAAVDAAQPLGLTAFMPGFIFRMGARPQRAEGISKLSPQGTCGWSRMLQSDSSRYASSLLVAHL